MEGIIVPAGPCFVKEWAQYVVVLQIMEMKSGPDCHLSFLALEMAIIFLPDMSYIEMGLAFYSILHLYDL